WGERRLRWHRAVVQGEPHRRKRQRRHAARRVSRPRRLAAAMITAARRTVTVRQVHHVLDTLIARSTAMKRIAILPIILAAMLAPFLAVTPAQALDLNTFVASFGNDMNPCTRAAPCLNF